MGEVPINLWNKLKDSFMISMFKNIVSSESDAKKYHLQSYHEMLEVALLKDYELNPNFLKSIQDEFNISEHEHNIIMQIITDSNDKLNINILNIVDKMDYLTKINNKIFDDYTIEISFLKNILNEEFNKYSENLFNLLDNIYINHETEFQACRKVFSYEKNEMISLNTKVYEFLPPTLSAVLEVVHNSLYYPSVNNQDKNLELILELLKFKNENINIAALIAMKNYSIPEMDLSKFLSSSNKDLKDLAKKRIKPSDEINIYEKMALLNVVPLFGALHFKELYSVALKSSMDNFKENDFILKQGENANNLYVIISGDVEVLKNDVKINELSSGDFFGEIAIVAKTKRTASVKATTQLSVLAFSEDSFNSLINEYPKISVHIMKEMTKRLLQNNS